MGQRGGGGKRIQAWKSKSSAPFANYSSQDSLQDRERNVLEAATPSWKRPAPVRPGRARLPAVRPGPWLRYRRLISGPGPDPAFLTNEKAAVSDDVDDPGISVGVCNLKQSSESDEKCPFSKEAAGFCYVLFVSRTLKELPPPCRSSHAFGWRDFRQGPHTVPSHAS
ncbi:Dynamin-like 120 kDa protein, mitochondrial [Podarcis lilfordi]|uniref:Dynamin-like 120 kDa protein, mitochondrial n=1 Tax=Podarcis lilfordi TaxID=74358 RepID=A0AA35PUG8_9SAUR|nr:Dynamin-like 120 kDa protein, mitochondrial [Podarcis lilfordi]